ncbi:hypothetical protein G4B88_005186, partial [Cannabis sativa]
LGLTAIQIKVAPKDALITFLPGFNGTFPSKHYSGYVTLEGRPHHKYLFYYIVVSERNPTKDPVVLWLNGGPGCSSMDGFVYEHVLISTILEMPFNFKAVKPHGTLPTLHLNPYSRSKVSIISLFPLLLHQILRHSQLLFKFFAFGLSFPVSNIIYLDSLAGVGFSYCKRTSYYETAASYTHKFLLKLFEEFLEFISNAFYIAEESYAGVYVPTLVADIVRASHVGSGSNGNGTNSTINLKARNYNLSSSKNSTLCSSPKTSWQELQELLLSFDSKIERLQAMSSNGKSINSLMDPQANFAQKPHVGGQGRNYHDHPRKGYSKVREKVFNALVGLNVYDILESCFHNSNGKKIQMETRDCQENRQASSCVKKNILSHLAFSSTSKRWNSSNMARNDRAASAWLNDENVRQAIHAAMESEIGEWELCCDRLSYDHDAGSMIPYQKNLTTLGLRVLIFSNFILLDCIGYHDIYVQGYDNNLTFLTIKNKPAAFVSTAHGLAFPSDANSPQVAAFVVDFVYYPEKSWPQSLADEYH